MKKKFLIISAIVAMMIFASFAVMQARPTWSIGKNNALLHSKAGPTLDVSAMSNQFNQATKATNECMQTNNNITVQAISQAGFDNMQTSNDMLQDPNCSQTNSGSSCYISPTANLGHYTVNSVGIGGCYPLEKVVAVSQSYSFDAAKAGHYAPYQELEPVARTWILASGVYFRLSTILTMVT